MEFDPEDPTTWPRPSWAFQANLFDKVGKMGVGVTELAQQATLSDEDTAERRAILEEVGPIFLAVIDGGGNRDVLSEKPCVLSASSVRSIT